MTLDLECASALPGRTRPTRATTIGMAIRPRGRSTPTDLAVCGFKDLLEVSWTGALMRAEAQTVRGGARNPPCTDRGCRRAMRMAAAGEREPGSARGREAVRERP